MSTIRVAPTSTPRMHISQLQYARLFAASLVLLSHAEHEIQARGYSNYRPISYFDLGLGVDIFFIISGFIMALLTQESTRGVATSLSFFWRRLRRVIPIYWLATSAFLVLSATAPGRILHSRSTWAEAVKSFLFIPYARNDGQFRPVLAIGWTLNYEMFFYVVVACSLAFVSKRKRACVLIGALGSLALMALLLPPLATASFWANPLVLEFAGGIIVFYVYTNVKKSSALLNLALACIACAVAVTGYTLGFVTNWRPLVNGLPAMVVVWLFLQSPYREVRSGLVALMHRGGDASYAIYLSHPFILNMCSLLLLTKMKLGAATFLLVSTLTCLFAGLAIHLYIESPLLSFLSRVNVSVSFRPSWGHKALKES